ncbi:MAG: dethiobiotin synthase, partial [Candidatus Margulisiibacteriota bacterium]
TVVTQKWVQSGDLDTPDISTHDFISDLRYDVKNNDDRQVYSFNDPVSPHLAARLANQTIEPDSLKLATRRLANAFDTVLVETSGGIMVPLSESVTTGDLVADMKLPTIVVVPNKLGTINHSLLTMQYLTQHNVPIIGFIINQFDDQQSPLHADNPKIIHAISNQTCIGICSA